VDLKIHQLVTLKMIDDAPKGVLVTNGIHTYRLIGTDWSGFSAIPVDANGEKEGRMTTLTWNAVGYKLCPTQ
jgi:hypothetical protein